MFQLEKLVRQNILSLEAYSTARHEFSGEEGIFLDANENPFGSLNRYPDPYQNELKLELSKRKGLAAKNVFVSNGSDEVIDLCFRIFCSPGKDKALICTPTYGMYEVAAGINQVDLIKLPLNGTFQIDLTLLEKQLLKDKRIKLIILCSPNNPTGNTLENIEEVLEKFNGIVLVDEAYIDFSNTPSFIERLSKYPNLIVCQTFSKAWGLAAARMGAAYASAEIIAVFNKVKAPYNVSSYSQKIALEALKEYSSFEQQKNKILEQRKWLEKELAELRVVKKVFPSCANFVLVEVVDADIVYKMLALEGIIVRNRNSAIRNCIRITVGKPKENQKLIEVMKELSA